MSVVALTSYYNEDRRLAAARRYGQLSDIDGDEVDQRRRKQQQ